jgi:thiol-disulfide isomerase/thioredoxin
MKILRARLLAGLFGLGLFCPFAAVAATPALDLDPYKGKVVYLDFWASWCGPCRLSFPWMNDAQSQFGSAGLVVIAVNVDHDRALAEKFLGVHGADFKVVFDPKGAIASQYKIAGMPTSVVIGRDGRVRYEHTGFFENREGEYDNQISQLLSEKAK